MAKKEEGEISDLRERTTVYATAKAPFHKEGDDMLVHPKTAEHFIKKGFATEKKAAAKKD
jgi:hypothetical protein